MAEELERNRCGRGSSSSARPRHVPRSPSGPPSCSPKPTATVADVLSGADDIVADPARVRTAAELIVSRVFLDIVALGEADTAAKRHAAMIDLVAESLTTPRAGARPS